MINNILKFNLIDGYLKDKIDKLEIKSGTKVYMIEGYSHLL